MDKNVTHGCSFAFELRVAEVINSGIFAVGQVERLQLKLHLGAKFIANPAIKGDRPF